MKAPHDMPVQILLVDDVPQNLVALEKILANRDYTLMKATSGQEALRIALREDLERQTVCSLRLSADFRRIASSLLLQILQ